MNRGKVMEIIGALGSLIGVLITAAIVIAVFLFVKDKRNPGMPAGGYCLSRTRRRFSYLGIALLLLFISFAVGVFSLSLLMEDKTGWDYTDYIRLAVGILGTLALLAGGIYEGYTAVRDTFFPEKSRLAASIRSQLPFPDGAPGYRELFHMVDKDIEENGQKFDRVYVGTEWILGDDASYIPLIRAVFGRNELKRVTGGRSTQYQRIVQLYIVDSRRQVQITGLRDPRQLNPLLACIHEHAPAAYFGDYDQYIGYCAKNDEEWAAMEREYQNRLAQPEKNNRVCG